MYRTAVTIYTTSLTFNNSTFCPHSVFMCFVWIWEQTAIISLYSINWMVCITETVCLLRGTDWMFTIQPDRGLYSLKYADCCHSVNVSTAPAFAATRTAVLRTVNSEQLLTVIHAVFCVLTLTLRLLMSYIYIYIYIWSAYSWCF